MNLTQFSQFFPERREFFLKNSDIFHLGDAARNTKVALAPTPDEDMLLFFSRRIGLSPDERNVAIPGGVRLTGQALGFTMEPHASNFAVMPPSNITVAIVQAEVGADLADTLERTRAGIRDARDAGASLVVFPETWIPGYPVWLDLCRDVSLWNHAETKAVFARMARDGVSVPGDTFHALAHMARDASVTLVIGVTERVERGPGRGTLYNSLLTIAADGRLLNHHRKLVPTYTERMVWAAETPKDCAPWTHRPGRWAA